MSCSSILYDKTPDTETPKCCNLAVLFKINSSDGVSNKKKMFGYWYMNSCGEQVNTRGHNLTIKLNIQSNMWYGTVYTHV